MAQLRLVEPAGLQFPHLPLEFCQVRVDFSPLRVRQVVQQATVVAVMKDAGEDLGVDVQSGIHQVNVVSSLRNHAGRT